nr:15581_t:CDS:2 [Entrophospora candida]
MYYPITTINERSLLLLRGIEVQLDNEGSLTSTLLLCIVNAGLNDVELHIFLSRPCQLYLPIEVLISPSTKNNKRKSPTRSQNDFILYRRNYNESLESQKDLGSVSINASEAWENESPEVRDFFKILAKLAGEKLKLLYPPHKTSEDQQPQQQPELLQQRPNEINNNHYPITLQPLNYLSSAPYTSGDANTSSSTFSDVTYTKDASLFPPCSTPPNELSQATQVNNITGNGTPASQTNLSDDFNPIIMINGYYDTSQEVQGIRPIQQISQEQFSSNPRWILSTYFEETSEEMEQSQINQQQQQQVQTNQLHPHRYQRQQQRIQQPYQQHTPSITNLWAGLKSSL